MKKLLIALGVLLVVLVGAVVVAPGFVDWNRYKAEIAAEAERATGRRLTIDGEVGLTLLPAPILEATQVSLANIDGGSEPEMLTLEALDIRVSLLPLLRGRLQVNSVSLVEPRILLEKLADGRTNWDFNPPDEAASEAATPAAPAPAEQPAEESPAAEQPAEPAGEPDREFQIRVDNFTIENGLLIYRDAAGGIEERVEAIDARIVAESLRGPFAVEGEAGVRGLRATLDGTVGRLPDAGAATLNVALGLPDSDAKAQFTGSLSRHPTSTEVRGKLKGQGGNLAALLRAVLPKAGRAGAGDLPAALGNPFTLEATLDADPDELKVEGLRVGLGDTAVEGSLHLIAGPPGEARIKLNSTHLDLDALLAAADEAPPAEAGDAAREAAGTPEAESDESAGKDEAAPAPTAETAEAEAEAGAGGFALPDDLEASLQLGVDALVYRQQVVRQIRLNVALSEGRLEVNQAMALLPGGSDVQLTGAVETQDRVPRFGGHLEAASDNLRGVLSWLGADLEAVPADRLRKASLTTRIDATPDQLSLSELDFRVDVSRLAGGVVAALRERPGLGIGLALDSLNLDAYLPVGGAPAGPAAEGDGADSDSAEAASEDAAAGADSGGSGTGSGGSGAAALGPLQAFDANLNLRIGSLVYAGQTARDIAVEGTLQDGRLSLKHARVADLAGSALAYSGTVAGLGARPELDGDIDLRIADPVRLARVAGVDAELIHRLGPFDLSGKLKGSLDGLGFDTRLALLGGNFGFSGTASPLAAPPAFDVTLDAEHPDLARLAGALTGPDGPLAGLGEGFGGLDVTARLAGTAQRFAVSDLNGTVGPLGLAGGFGLALGPDGPAPEAVDLAVHLEHGSLAALSRAAGGPGLADGLGGVDVKGRVAGDGRAVKLSELSGVAGPLGISGEVALDLDAGAAGGARQALGDFNLNLRLKHGSLATLAAAAGAADAVNPGFGGVDLGAHVFGNASQISLRDLQGSLGPVSLTGTASVDLAGAKPFVTAELSTGELPLSRLLASAAPVGAGSGGGGGTSGGAGGTGAGSLSPRWSAQPLDLSALQALNADVKLKSTVLSYDKVRLNDADLAALLTDGLLELKQLTGRVHGGQVLASGRLDANGVPQAGLQLRASEVESGTLLVEMAEFERVSGPVSINATLQTQGRSQADLVSQLAGQGDIAGTLSVKAKAEEAIGSALLGILGQQVKEVRGLTDTVGALFQAFAGAPSRLNGTFAIKGGVIRTEDLRLDGRDAVALTVGEASLPAWFLDSRTDVYQGQPGGQPFLTAEITGPLDEPNTRVGGAALQRQPQPAAPSEGEGSGESGTTEPSLPAIPGLGDDAPSAEDLLKGLLKKLD